MAIKKLLNQIRHNKGAKQLYTKLEPTGLLMTVVAGTDSLKDAKASIKSEKAQIRESKRIVIHKDYTWNQKFVNDLAVIEMSEAFEPSEWVNVTVLNKTRSDVPLMVPEQHAHNSEEVNIPCSSYSFGQGKSSKGYRIKGLDYMVNKHCHCLEWIRSYKSPVDILRQRNIFICARNVKNHDTVCEGDNGAPLMCGGALRGLVTSLFHYKPSSECKMLNNPDKMKCTNDKSYVVFTDLCYFSKWLSSVVSSYPHVDELCNPVTSW